MRMRRILNNAVPIMAVVIVLVIGAACQSETALQGEPAAANEPIPAAEPTPAVAPEPTEQQQSATGAEEPTPESKSQTATQNDDPGAPRVNSLREVDFRNGFSYDPKYEFNIEDDAVTVQDGSAEVGEPSGPDYLLFVVGDVAYGDLDGDGIEEAAVQTTVNFGGTGLFDTVRVYRLVDGQAEFADAINFGDRADGGVYRVSILDRAVRVSAFAGGEGACCPNSMREVSLALGEHKLTETEVTGPVRWVPLHDSQSTQDELKFLPNTDSALLTMYGFATEGSVMFEAGAGQRISLRTIDGPFPTSAVLTNLETGEVRDQFEDAVLDTTGLYEVVVNYQGERDVPSMMRLSIDGAQFSADVSWVPAVEQVLIDDDPLVYSSVSWPVFVSSQPGTAAVNRDFAALVRSLDDPWVSDVREFENPEELSSYEVTYEMLLVTADLVSVRLDYFDYVCCRPYPNYGARSGVLDLAAGRIVPVEEILDTFRIDEIKTLWFAELERQVLLPPGVAEGPVNVTMDSVTLTPTGVEIGTDRGGLGGGTPGTLTVLTYEQLGGLVNTDLAARAQR